MNRTALLLLIAAAITAVAGVGLYSPRAAVIVAALLFGTAGVLSLELPSRDRSGS